MLGFFSLFLSLITYHLSFMMILNDDLKHKKFYYPQFLVKKLKKQNN